MTNEVRNSKFEEHAQFEARDRNQAPHGAKYVSAGFRASDLFRISSFGFRIFLVLLSLCVAIGVIGCATEKKQKWLTFFFDGVPATGSVTNSPRIEYDENGKPLDKLVVVQPNQPSAPKP